MSPAVSVTRFLEVAHKLDCLPVILDQLLPFIEPTQERCQLAKRYNRHRIVIDVIFFYYNVCVCFFFVFKFNNQNFYYITRF